MVGYNAAQPTTSNVSITANDPNITITSGGKYSFWFNRKTYTLTLNKGTGITAVNNGGTSTTSAKSYKWGATVDIDATVNTDAGYEWVNWTTGTSTTVYSTTKATTVTIGTSNLSYKANAQDVGEPTVTLTGGTTSIIVEPNYDTHTNTGVSNASTYYNQTTSAGSGQAALAYKGVKAAITTPIILVNTNPGGTADSTHFGDIGTLYRTNTAYSAGAATGYEAYKGATKEAKLLNVFHLSTGITKIRVYMWVEGQDVDCENAASGSFLTYTLGFTLDDEE